jgi:hypothetical protein
MAHASILLAYTQLTKLGAPIEEADASAVLQVMLSNLGQYHQRERCADHLGLAPGGSSTRHPFTADLSKYYR